MYAVIDIETTGGKFNEEGITEIAIYKYDGHTIVDKFVSLINPEREIQPFVVKLTGISNKMLKNAPKFYEVAKRIIEITNNCTLVAHNAKFDSRILTTEFKRLGYNFKINTICTVELSKKLIPEMPSYKLGKLCRSLGIPVSDRHRAEGDAKATVELFELLLTKDAEKNIIKTILKGKKEKFTPKTQVLIDKIPNCIGVFYMHHKNGDILYIGKGKNIKKTVTNIFLRKSINAKKLHSKISYITYDKTGNQLISSLLYENEVYKTKPKFNQRRKIPFEKIKFNNNTFLIIDKGRTLGEKSVVLIENQKVIGFTFVDLAYQITNQNVLKNLLTPLKNTTKNKIIIKKHLQQKKVKKIIRL